MKRLIVVGLLALVPVLAGGCGGSQGAATTAQDPRCSARSLTLRAVPAQGRSVTAAGMQVARRIMENRLHTLGVSSPQVSVRGDEIVIRLGGVHHAIRVAKIAGSTGLLQIFDFAPSLAAPSMSGNGRPAPDSSLYSLLASVQTKAGNGTPQGYFLFKTGTGAKASGELVHGDPPWGAPSIRQLLRPYKNGKQPAHTRVLALPAHREAVACELSSGACPGADGQSRSGTAWYLFKGAPELTGKDLVESGITADLDPSSGPPIVALEFTRHGSLAFRRITKAEYDRGRVNAGLAGELSTRNPSAVSRYAGHSAIVLDGRLREAPYIDYTDATLAQGIVGNAELTEPSAAAAKDTALVLRSGSLPYSFQPVTSPSCPR